MVTLLTGGGDRPYVFGLATSIISKGIALDVIGSDELDCPQFRENSRVNFLNLRGDQQPDSGISTKILRVLKYYLRLVCYAAKAKPRIFHILWNNKFESFDRTVLMLYYKLLGKHVVLTVHNVNAGKRDSKDTFLNRVTLRIQYRLSDHLFVHTEDMKAELAEKFGVQRDRVTVIPFGINNAVPNTHLSSIEAKQRLGILNGEKTILFFGNIAPYKGLEYLIKAFRKIRTHRDDYRLIVAGRPKKCEKYWRSIESMISEDDTKKGVLLKADFIPDEETEIYFKAADVLALPYVHIFQSGVLFLGYSFGLPVIAAKVGSLQEDVIEGKTGFLCTPCDPSDLARAIETYFGSDVYKHLVEHRQEIRNIACKRHSWDAVSEATCSIYARLALHSRPKSTKQTTDDLTESA
jgi:D-inositol-3-phosphate glycosyltransferase